MIETNTKTNCVDKKFSVFRKLREEKRLSQRALAKKMQVSRIQLQWMENKHPERLSLKELILFSEALQFSPPVLMRMMGIVGENHSPQIARASMDRPATSVKYEDGVELGCFMEDPRSFFVGRLALAARKNFPIKKLPGEADFMFATVLQGAAFIQGNSSPFILKEKEGFYLKGRDSLKGLEFFNSSSAQKLQIMLFLHFSEALLV